MQFNLTNYVASKFTTKLKLTIYGEQIRLSKKVTLKKENSKFHFK